MKRLSVILTILLAYTHVVNAQETKTRTLSYSQLFDEMTSSEEIYRLTNAIIEYNNATDRRFLEADSTQLANFDTIKINCKVSMDEVIFQNTSDNINLETGDYLPEIGFQKIFFADSVICSGCTIEVNSIAHCSFLSSIEFSSCNFSNSISFENCIFKKGLILWSSNVPNGLRVESSTLNGYTQFVMLNPPSIIEVKHCVLDQFLMEWSSPDRFIFKHNRTNSNITFQNNTIGHLEIFKNHFSNRVLDSIQAYLPLINISNISFKKFTWLNNKYELLNRHASCLHFARNTIADRFILSHTDFTNPISLTNNNIGGAFEFGKECNFRQGVYIYETYFNEQGTITWRNLSGKMFLSDYSRLRQDLEFKDSIQSFGLLERELGNMEYCEALIKNKRMFYNVFKTQGLSTSANAVMVEIKDLETEIWRHAYFENKTIKAFFNWKMNLFLKKYSAYGTDPVLAIIYSIKVILLFGLLYLFFHNDWDVGSRKKIGRRLHFMLKYFKVNKGLAELDDESQSEIQQEVLLLKLENEASTDKIPDIFSRAVRWYVKSNMISDSLRKTALKKMDILSGTYSKLPKNRKRSVALLSGIWFVAFLLYTLLLKILNALTLSLNAFTTLGFGNIPTKGFSRYIVIIQGFIGWILMTIFSVTLISQLIQ